MNKNERLRGMVMFVIACFTSPCCTPLIVPLVITLLAGTPAALWISQYFGWVYGGLTLISIVSFMLALRWMRQHATARPSTIRSSDIPVLSTGEKVHVE
ncbi:MAG: hypothetical protein K8L97_12535 [Anaerolineae bacterium]|nr:hypothetical protein [Anaerolineae bacterium]